ncbi:MAG: hypothetical protein U1D55_02070 [Phycisphaerae bacterium]
MSQASHEFDPQLIDSRLRGENSQADSELSQRLANDPDLAAQDRALASLIAALSSYRVPTTPVDLARRVSARVAAAGAAPRVLPADPAIEGASPAILRLSNLREIVAVAAMIVLAIGVGVPSLLHVRERNERVACSWNLAQIGRGLSTYATAFRGDLPFVGWGRNSSWTLSDQRDVQAQPNRRHLYPLLAGGIAPPAWFVCPAVPGAPMPSDQIRLHDDFLESSNVTYAYQNMAGLRPTTRSIPDLPILADDNPLFENGVPLLDLARRIGLHDPAAANSRAHGGGGQNVLTVGGNVKWTSTPLSGLNGDNIWTLQDVNSYTGREGPQKPTDSHLLK